jgi:hypothetical protein
MVGVLAASAATNATVAFNGGIGALVAIVVIVFTFISLGVTFIASEILSRSRATLTNLQSIGAGRRDVFRAMLGTFTLSGAAGTAAGVALGSAYYLGLGSGYSSLTFLSATALVLAAGCLAAPTGLYFGVGRSWRR